MQLSTNSQKVKNQTMRPKLILLLQNYPSCFVYFSLQILYTLDLLLTEYSKQDENICILPLIIQI